MPKADPILAPLVGSWRLLSATARFADTGEEVATFGPAPIGRVVVTPSGRIMFLITRGDRQPPVSDADCAAIYDSMITYSGTVRSDGTGAFITSVDVSLIPSEVGHPKRRMFVVEGDRLTIRLPEQQSRFGGGRRSTSELTWQREPPLAAPVFAPLLGSWRLRSVEAVFADNGERAAPWGKEPLGRMVLDGSGRIMFLIMRAGRQPPTDAAMRATLFRDMLSYTGRIRLDGAGRFITAVDLARDPSEIGEERLRHFSLDGDRLVVRVPEQVNPRTQGRRAYFDNLFEREHAVG